MTDDVKMDSEEVKKLIRKRAVIKRKITIAFKELGSNPTAAEVKSHVILINKFLEQVANYDNDINELICLNSSDGEQFSSDEQKELDSQVKYAQSINVQLSDLKIPQDEKPNITDKPSLVKLNLPDLKCDVFDGEVASHLKFHSFLSQFQNVIGLRANLSASCKLTYLKSYLRGYALKLVQHLQISDQNYEVALTLLRNEFLNVNAIISDLFQKLLNLKPKYDTSFLETKIFLNEIRCVLSDLKLYEINLISEPSANKFLSHIVFNRLPNVFQQELVRKLDDNYPCLDDIMENYVEVVRTLNIRQPRDSKGEGVSVSKPNSSSKSNIINKSSVSNDVNKPIKNCKFCCATGHVMLHCRKYATNLDRKNRCKELNLCELCSSQRHKSDSCSKLDFQRLFCSSNKHISALCSKYMPKVTTNFCLNTTADSGRTFILPSIKIQLGNGKNSVMVKCLLDTGSQRSYLSSSVLTRLGSEAQSSSEFKITTFLDAGNKLFQCAPLCVRPSNNKVFILPFLVHDDCDLNYVVEGLGEAHANISQVATVNNRTESDLVQLEGLLGVDFLQYMDDLKLVSCLGGVAFNSAGGLIPFGNVDNFLNDHQLKLKYSNGNCRTDVEQIDNSLVNFVLSPEGSQTNFDPIGSIVQNSSVDPHLDRIFSLESLGISDEDSDYDRSQIENFKNNVELIENRYFI